MPACELSYSSNFFHRLQLILMTEKFIHAAVVAGNSVNISDFSRS